MNNIQEDNFRYIFQLIKNHADKQEKKIQNMQKELDDLSTENSQLKRQVQELAQHAIVDNVVEEGGGEDE